MAMQAVLERIIADQKKAILVSGIAKAD